MQKALGPKERKAFRDNYLAAWMLGLALLFSFGARAQYDSSKIRQANNAYGFDFKNVKFGSAVMPRDTIKMAVSDSGAIAYKGGSYWAWTGYYWKLSSGSGGAGTTNITTFRTPSGDSIRSSTGSAGFIALADMVNAGAFGPDGVKQLDSLHRYYDSIRLIIRNDSLFLGIKPAATGIEILYFQDTLPAPTLPTVNSTPGTWGDATHVPQYTVDAQGRIHVSANVVIAGSVTNLNYVASPTDGTITSSTGSSAHATLADHLNAGLQSPGDKARSDSQVYVLNPPAAYGGASTLVSASSGTVDTLYGKRDSLQGTQGVIASQDTSNPYRIINKVSIDSNWIKALTGWGGSGGSSTYAGLSDVLLTSLATNQMMKWNGTKWVNVTMGTAAFKDVPSSGDASTSQVVYGTDSRLADSRVPNGTAGGDLTGSYPNPTVGTNKITNTQAAQMANATIKGRSTAGTGNPEDLTASQVATIINSSIAIAQSQVSGLTTALSGKMANNGNSTGFKAGTFSARPSASTCLCYYVATDSTKLYYDNGSWITIGGGGGGGGTSSPVVDTVQRITARGAVSANTGVNTFIIDPAAPLDSVFITLPATPSARNTFKIFFGGTITPGNTVVGYLQLIPNTGQSLVRNPIVGLRASADDALGLKFYPTLTYWLNEQ